MTTIPIEQELIALEREYWQALQDRNVDRLMELTDFPCLVSGSCGARSVSAEEYRTMVEGSKNVVRSFQIGDDATARLLTDDVAVVTYRVHHESANDGRTVSQDAADMSTWVNRDGHWTCAAHAETAIDPGK